MRTLLACQRREGEHGDVAIVLPHRLWLRERLRERPRTMHLGLCKHDLLHRLLRFHPRPARFAPPRAIVDRQLHADSVRLRDGKLRQVPPFGTPGQHSSGGRPRSDVENLRPSHTDALHGFQIKGDPNLADVAVAPVPPGVRLGGIGRSGKTFFEIVGKGLTGQCADYGDHSNSLFHLWLHFTGVR